MTVLMRMPNGPNSAVRLRHNPGRAAFVAWYADMPAWPRIAPVEEMKMMLALSDFARWGAAVWANRKGIRRLRATERSHMSCVHSLSGAESMRAAVTNTVSSEP